MSLIFKIKEFFIQSHTIVFCMQVDLEFSLGEEKTIVSSKIKVSPRIEGLQTLAVLFHLHKKI